MKKLFSIITLSIIILLLLSMSVSGGKKGVGGPGGCPSTLDLPFLYHILKVDWAYTWAPCLWPMPSVEYVPMVRRGIDVARVRQIINHYGAGGYWLVGNEPDNQWQDNLTPMETAVVYGEITNVILGVDPSARIILGNFSHPSQYFRETWFAQFKTAWLSKWNEDVTTRIAGWGIHAYAHRFSSESQQNAIDRTQRQVAAWQAENPRMELWVTEYGNLWETDAETMRQMTTWLEEHVDRYAYFYFGDKSTDWDCTSLYGDPWPMLTELGEAYINLPDKLIPTPVPTSTPSVTLMPSITLTPSVISTIVPVATKTTATGPIATSPAATATLIAIPTPPPQPPMPETLLGVAQEQLRVTWRLERSLYAVSVIVISGIAYMVKIMQEINSKG